MTSPADNQKLSMNFIQKEAVNYRRSRYFMLITVLLGLVCVLLVIAVLVQHNKLSTERDLMKMSYVNVEYSEALSSLKMNCSRLNGEREDLQKNLTYMIQKKLQLEAELKKCNSERGSCRYFISSEEKSWSDGRRFCRDHGADLVIINTEEEQKFISSLIKQTTWIGLSDTLQEGVMKWVDGTSVNKGFWLQGEPNNMGGDEDCVEMQPSLPPENNWNDHPCSVQKRLICEK
ncbi:CD209 antigen-like protein E [Triplophysa rosa]|uniref:CD209 antigen n=1 Tax=Triplophysa rosa TaxID=992332 RepID=A0A9W8C8V0_TRIRA|nr:CD209 antigen-like protein E [Triplophysa rosa]KAI7811270.1 putative CD209 antigen [Triplophysa rosa]